MHKFILNTATKAYNRYDSFMCNSSIIKKLIDTQHKIIPMPISTFDFIFRSSILKHVFNFYGYNVWKCSYDRRDGDNASYWTSNESMYWHSWRQTEINHDLLKEVLSINDIKQAMQNKSFIAFELGFGTGKNYSQYLKYNNLKQYIAVELNPFACEYSWNKFKSVDNFFVVNQSVKEFVESVQRVDVLVCSGGVFMYLDKQTVDTFFDKLHVIGIKTIIILDEGTWKNDMIREDNTTMYNFKYRLTKAGYEKAKYVENKNSNGIYRYFIMQA